MPSNYSALKIELITTGEQSGTWGDTTNVNLGTAVEEAITGSATVNFSGANVTLTLIDNNTSQPARNLRLLLTGTTGGPRNLFVPAIKKQYIVKNDTADIITIRNATGTGVAVPNGTTAIVYNDSSNIFSANTFSTEATLGTPLAVTSGGTGTNTSTGTGSVVRATSPTLSSPTLTTPILGTPQAGSVLTNCTGLPLTSGVTGILPVANGGTNTTTSTGSGSTVLSANPIFTGVPEAPTAANGTSTTQIATTAFVQNSLPVAFPAGTRMSFQQTAAPTGWTKDTTAAINNSALRFVTGAASSGGSVDFTTAFASQAVSGTVAVTISAGTLAVGAGTLGVQSHILDTTQIPSHTHTGAIATGTSFSLSSSKSDNRVVGNSGATGGGLGHTHGLAGSPSLSGSPSVTGQSFTGTAINLAVKYYDFIIASKD